MCSEEDSKVSHCGMLKWFAIKQAILLKCSSMHALIIQKRYISSSYKFVTLVCSGLILG